MPITVQCQICGKEFQVKPYKKNTAKYCSLKCKNESLKNKVPHNKHPDFEFTCSYCGKQFTRPLWYLEKIGIPKTCSKICHNRRIAQETKQLGRNKENKNPSWKGGRSVTYYRRLFNEVLPKVCSNCGNTDNLVVHHLDHDRTNNQLENLTVLCKRCHQIHHDCTKNLPNVSSSCDQPPPS